MRIASGEFIAFCDADDMWNNAKLETQVDLLRSQPEYDVTYSDALIVDEEGRFAGYRFSHRFPPPKSPSGCLFVDLLSRNFINIQTVLIRKRCVHSAGYFDENVKWVEDWWYWIVVSHHHRFLYTPVALAKYRVHSQSTNVIRRRGYYINRIKVFRRILHRYPDLLASAKADILYQMGTDLCELGRSRIGRHVLLKCAASSVMDIRALRRLSLALARILVSLLI